MVLEKKKSKTIGGWNPLHGVIRVKNLSWTKLGQIIGLAKIQKSYLLGEKRKIIFPSCTNLISFSVVESQLVVRTTCGKM